MAWKLYDKATGAEIVQGDKVKTSDGEEWILRHLRPPHKPSSSGHVTLVKEGETLGPEYYAGVIGAVYRQA